MMETQTIVDYCDQLLDIGSFEDYCPNGLQIDAGEGTGKLVTGVTASEALIDAAIASGADTLLVHHGFFWKGEAASLTGIKGRRIRKLMQAGISLMAYHLPLDAHSRYGNNYQLGKLLGLADPVAQDAGGLLWGARLNQPASADTFAERIGEALGRVPLHLPGGADLISRVAWCTGAAQGYIEKAAAAGFDAFISGEVSEQTTHLAAELGIHYFAAGHHATERYGVQALGEILATQFNIEHQFIDIDNPV